jgi:cation transport ATPase
MKKTYKIDVDCANCAAKMEEAAKKTEGVKDCVVNFMTLKMKVEFEDEEKIITLNVSGVKYAVKASDLAKLIEMADVQLQKMMDSLKLSMYQSALISAFGSGVVDFSQEYSKGLADEILT